MIPLDEAAWRVTARLWRCGVKDYWKDARAGRLPMPQKGPRRWWEVDARKLGRAIEHWERRRRARFEEVGRRWYEIPPSMRWTTDDD